MTKPNDADPDTDDVRPPYGQPRRRPFRAGDVEYLERARELDELSPGPVIDRFE